MGRLSQANAPVTEAGTFPAPQLQPRPFSSSSSVLHPSDSISQLNGCPSSTLSVLPSHRHSGNSISSILNGAEDFLRPMTSGSSAVQRPTLSVQRQEPFSNETHPQENQRGIFALPQDATDGVRTLAQLGATTSVYWNESPRFQQSPKPPSKTQHLVNSTSTPSTAWSAPLTRSSRPLINLYEPRPSTAPVLESQGLSDMLPPKRDLPFVKPMSRPGLKSSTRTNGTLEVVLPALAAKENG